MSQIIRSELPPKNSTVFGQIEQLNLTNNQQLLELKEANESLRKTIDQNTVEIKKLKQIVNAHKHDFRNGVFISIISGLFVLLINILINIFLL